VLASHHNCRALVPGDRQLTDDQIRRLVARGAVIGVGLDAWMLSPGWERGKTQPQVVVARRRRRPHRPRLPARRRMPPQRIGSDLDGGFGTEQTPRDLDTIADLQKLAGILAAAATPAPTSRRIFHGNFLRLFTRGPPDMSDRERKLESSATRSQDLSAGRSTSPSSSTAPRLRLRLRPLRRDKNLASKGKVPSQVSLEDARKAAALCAANVLRLVRQELGSLDRVERVLRVTGYVNSDADFTDQHLVINGAVASFVDVFGDAGWHARSAVGWPSSRWGERRGGGDPEGETVANRPLAWGPRWRIFRTRPTPLAGEDDVAHIRPFAGIHYARHRDIDFSNVIAPPYDVLDEQGKAALQARHPNNIVTVDLPHLPPKTVGPDEVYDKANTLFQAWLEGRRAEARHAAGAVPLQPELRAQRPHGPPRGFVCLVRLSPSAGPGRAPRADLRQPHRRPAEADAFHRDAAVADLRAVLRLAQRSHPPALSQPQPPGSQRHARRGQARHVERDRRRGRKPGGRLDGHQGRSTSPTDTTGTPPRSNTRKKPRRRTAASRCR
jgi:hypothetical protein